MILFRLDPDPLILMKHSLLSLKIEDTVFLIPFGIRYAIHYILKSNRECLTENNMEMLIFP